VFTIYVYLYHQFQHSDIPHSINKAHVCVFFESQNKQRLFICSELADF